MRALLPTNAVEIFRPIGLHCWADADKDDMEKFRTELWPEWLKHARPPIV
jgi:hypothetical protein